MTSREWGRKAFNHQEPDRVPVFEIHIGSKPAIGKALVLSY